MTEGTGILVVENLRKEFRGIAALRGIDIVLDKPGVYGFLGPNGAGKTTTFKLISGLLTPTSGRVLVDGIDVATSPRRAMTRLGVQFDSPVFYPYLSGRDNLLVIARWLDGPVDANRVDALLDQVGLGRAADRKVGGYSWGMRQRLGLASALLSDPSLVLLDEPTNGLDPAGIADVRSLLPRLAHDEGRTVFLSSHRMTEVEQICDHVTIIHEGEIAASGAPAELASPEPTVDVRCADAADAGRILAEMAGGITVRMVSATELSVLGGGATPADINKWLVERGVAVEQVVSRSESLEQVFFRLTGGRAEPGDPCESGGAGAGADR
jgi:ABC-2 type transport system ATP-binding protein